MKPVLFPWRRRALATFCLLMPLLTLPACGGSSTAAPGNPPPVPTPNPIKHVVFIVKENRSFDNMFGTFAGANGATRGITSTGAFIPLSHTPDQVRDIGHDWYSAIEVIHSGKMDRFDLNYSANQNADYLAYSQLTGADIPNYFT